MSSLAVVYGIVKQSGGTIDVTSELNRGSSFRVFLPSIDQAAPSSEPRHDAPTTRQGTETLLLVEDDNIVRNLASFVLRQLGYSVLEAANGREARRIFESNAGVIRLLVSDVIMPGMSGPELADQLTGLQPDLKVLFVSGYTDEALHLEETAAPSRGFLQKPFTPSTLSRKVRDMLDAPCRLAVAQTIGACVSVELCPREENAAV